MEYGLYAIDVDGHLWSCGYNLTGMLGHGHWNPITKLTKIKTVDSYEPRFVSFKQGGEYIMALDEEGYLWSCGRNDDGQLGRISEHDSPFFAKINENMTFKDYDCTDGSSIAAIDEYGYLWCGGRAFGGVLSLTKPYVENEDFQHVSLESISFGYEHIAAIDENGNILVLDSFDKDENCYRIHNTNADHVIANVELIFLDKNSQLYLKDFSSTSIKNLIDTIKCKIKTSKEVTDSDGNIWIHKYTKTLLKPKVHINLVSVGFYDELLALDINGSVWVYGNNKNNTLGLANYESVDNLTKLNINATIIDVKICEHSLLLDSDGNIWSCGNNQYGQLGHGNFGKSLKFKKALKPQHVIFTSICCNFYFTVALDSNGNIWTCGGNGYGQLGHGDYQNRNVLTLIESDVQFSNIDGIKSKKLNIKSAKHKNV